MLLTNMKIKSSYIRNNTILLLGDLEPFKVDTYRYIYPLCKKFKTKFKQKSYPPYKKGIELVSSKPNKNLIKERLIAFIGDIK